MSMSYLQQRGLTDACTGGFNDVCWLSCNQNLYFQQKSSTLADFGPRYSTVSPDNQQNCDCDQYNVYGARISQRSSDNAPQAIGSSPNNDPFSVVTLRRTSTQGLTATWIGGGSASSFGINDTCSALYATVAGPIVLPNSSVNDYFTAWWAVLIGCIFGLLLLSCLASWCFYFTRRRVKRRSDSQQPLDRIPRTNSDPTQAPQGPVPPAYRWNYHRSSMNVNALDNQPTVRFPSNDIPVAVAIPVDENGRQIAIV